MYFKYLPFALILYFVYQLEMCNTETVTFIDTERPEVTWYDSNVVQNITTSARRFSRQDPRHYLDMYLKVLIKLDDNIKIHFYFFQFLTNRYKPSFVEMHFGLCEVIEKDAFFGVALRKALENYPPCPFPPGEYDLRNITISYLPNGFPFIKGRIYVNASIEQNGVNKVIVRGHIDMEIKKITIKNTKKRL